MTYLYQKNYPAKIASIIGQRQRDRGKYLGLSRDRLWIA